MCSYKVQGHIFFYKTSLLPIWHIFYTRKMPKKNMSIRVINLSRCLLKTRIHCPMIVNYVPLIVDHLICPAALWEVIDQLIPKKYVWTFELHNTKHKIQRVMKWTFVDEIQSKINSVPWVDMKRYLKVYNTIFWLD